MKKKILITLGGIIGVGSAATIGTVMAFSHKIGSDNLQTKYIIENAFQTPLVKNELLAKINNLSKDNINSVLSRAGLNNIEEKDGFQINGKKFINIEDAKKELNDKYSNQIKAVVINKGNFSSNQLIPTGLDVQSVNTYYVYNHKVYNQLIDAQNAWLADNPSIPSTPGLISVKIPVLSKTLRIMPINNGDKYSKSDIFKLFNWTKIKNVAAPALEADMGAVSVSTNKGTIYGAPTHFRSDRYYSNDENPTFENFQTLREPDNTVDVNLRKVYDLRASFGINKKMYINSRYSPTVVVKKGSIRQPVISINGKITNIPFDDGSLDRSQYEIIQNRKIYNSDGSFIKPKFITQEAKEHLFNALYNADIIYTSLKTSTIIVGAGRGQSIIHPRMPYFTIKDKDNNPMIFDIALSKSEVIDRILALENAPIGVTLGHDIGKYDATYDFYLSDGHGTETLIDRRFLPLTSVDFYKTELEKALSSNERIYRSIQLGQVMENVMDISSISMESEISQPQFVLLGKEYPLFEYTPFNQDIFNLDGTMKRIVLSDKIKTDLYNNLVSNGILKWTTIEVNNRKRTSHHKQTKVWAHAAYGLDLFVHKDTHYEEVFVAEYNYNQEILANMGSGSSKPQQDPVAVINKLLSSGQLSLKESAIGSIKHKYTYYANKNDGTKEAIDVKFLDGQTNANEYLETLKKQLQEVKEYKNRGIVGLYSFTFQGKKYFVKGPKNFESVNESNINIDLGIYDKNPRREYGVVSSSLGQIVGNTVFWMDRWIEPNTILHASNLKKIADSNLPSTKQKYSFVILGQPFFIVVDKNVNISLNDINIQIKTTREYIKEKYEYFWELRANNQLFYKIKTTLNEGSPIFYPDDIQTTLISSPIPEYINSIVDIPSDVITRKYSQDKITNGQLESTMSARDDTSATQGFAFDGMFYRRKEEAIAAMNTKIQEEVQHAKDKVILYKDNIYYNWESVLLVAKKDLKDIMEKIDGKYTYDPNNFI